jgi:SAM-dependent methyltransferase
MLTSSRLATPLCRPFWRRFSRGMQSVPGARTEHFKTLYASGESIPWDVNQPQSGVVLAESRGWFTSPVLDVGCGYGNNGIFLASKGHKVSSFDASRDAVEEARKRAAAAGDLAGTITFEVGDVYSHGLAEGSFQTLLDSAVFHCMGDDDAQLKYVDSISSAVAVGGRLVLLCFSDDNPDPWVGPRRISEAHARRMWESNGLWRFDSVEPIKINDVVHDPLANGYLIRATRL